MIYIKLKLINYWYFRDVYLKAKRKQRIIRCQFLPYKTGFQDIYEALDMSEARVELQHGESPWYFGWSNCQADTAEEFRKHYSRPYFLPESSENNAVDWIFIGTAGLGAQMHVSYILKKYNMAYNLIQLYNRLTMCDYPPGRHSYQVASSGC